MALKKEYTTEQGFTADYWKVEYISIDKNRYEFSFTLNLYLNEERAATTDAFIKSETISIYHNIDGENLDDLSSTDAIRKERFNAYFDDTVEYSNMYEACYN